MSEAAESEAKGLSEALAELVRTGSSSLHSSLIQHGEALTLETGHATLRLYFVQSDPNGLPRVDALAEQLALQIILYCIPRSRINTLAGLPAHEAAVEAMKMGRDARDLFTQGQPQTGEAAELLLYALLEQELGLPQLLCKMSLKTNTNVQYHGADGIHAKLLDDGMLALYWGEAKLYTSVADAMTSCLDDIKPFVTGEGTQQDLFLLRHYVDVDNDELKLALLKYFDNKNAEAAKLKMCGACLVAFSHDDYPVMPRDAEALAAELTALVEEWSLSMTTRITNRAMETFELEVFFVPVPSADGFRAAVKKAIWGAA